MKNEKKKSVLRDVFLLKDGELEQFKSLISSGTFLWAMF